MEEQANDNRPAIPGRNGGTLRPYRPGESGNPAGMKKGTKQFATILKAFLDEQIDFDVDGQIVKVTRAEALMLQKIKLALNSPFDSIRLRAIMDIEDRIDGRPLQADREVGIEDEEVVVFYIPNQYNRKRRPEDLDAEDIPALPGGAPDSE